MLTPLLWEPPLPPAVRRSPRPLPEAVHVVLGASAGGALRQAGAGPLIPAPDTLTVGPARAQPGAHARARMAFWTRVVRAAEWNEPEEAPRLMSGRDLALAARQHPTRRILLWTTGEWRGLLFLAWALDGLLLSGVAAERIWTASDLRATWPLSYLNPEQLRTVARKARPVDRRIVAAAAKLWSAFVAPDPSLMERLRRTPPAALPTLRRCLSLYAALLPMASPRHPGLLGPSALDGALLASLSAGEWRRFPDLVQITRRSSWPQSGVWAGLCHYGDVFLEARLAALCEGRRPAAERTSASGGPFRSSFRLTRRGEILLREGVDGPDQLPPVEIGGYSSRAGAPWVCLIDRGSVAGASWRLARWLS